MCELFHRPISSFVHPSFVAHLAPNSLTHENWLSTQTRELLFTKALLALQNQYSRPPEDQAAALRVESLATVSLPFNLTGAMITNICKWDAQLFYLLFKRAISRKQRLAPSLSAGKMLRTAGRPTKRALECRLGLSATQKRESLL